MAFWIHFSLTRHVKLSFAAQCAENTIQHHTEGQNDLKSNCLEIRHLFFIYVYEERSRVQPLYLMKLNTAEVSLKVSNPFLSCFSEENKQIKGFAEPFERVQKEKRAGNSKASRSTVGVSAE